MSARASPTPAILIVASVGFAAAGLPVPRIPDAPSLQATEGEPYLGVSVRDTPEGLVVGWLYPGPTGGTGQESRVGLRRGDNVVAVYRANEISPSTRVEVSTAAEFDAFLSSMLPGETMSIEARRSPTADARGAVPRGGEGGDVTVYSLTLADRRDWTGTVRAGLGERVIEPAREGEFEAEILSLAAEVGVRDAEGGLDALLAYLAGVQEANLDPNSLPAVVRSFRRPLSVDAVEGEIAVLASSAAEGDWRSIVGLVRHVLDVPAFGEVSDRLDAIDLDLASVRDDARSLVAWGRSDVSVGGPDAGRQIRAIRAGGEIIGPLLSFQLHVIPTMNEWEALGRVYGGARPLDELPASIRGAVTGEVLYVHEFPNGTVGVVGGAGPNTYDMSVVTDVYDLGGDDTYTFARADDRPAGGNHHVIDVAGDDIYEARTDFAGPAVGVFGVSIVDDRSGDDIYRSSRQFSIGAGLFGLGILIDHAGNDRYENLGPGAGWSTGVGYYGAGLVIDRAGNDAYFGEQLTQGVGGPCGFGAIIDARGDDSYRANGPSFASVYGTEGVYKGFGQGFGIGVRGYASGGLGAIYDLSGNDRYEAGEFAQGCAYYFAMGVLHDRAGDDEYVGNRYGQASAAHQAIGVLIDDGGDDAYRSMTAASQAGVWDQSIALLIDRSGDDTYHADGLSQGAASMQALGLLLDLGGADAYRGAGHATQGHGGANTYHFDADGLLSFSALIDRGGGDDSYSSGRENGSTVATGARDEATPSGSTLYGVFSDR